MPQIWKEKFDPARHQDKMDSLIHSGATLDPHRSLRGRWVYFVNVAGFTFTFMSIEQVELNRPGFVGGLVRAGLMMVIGVAIVFFWVFLGRGH